MKSFEICLLKIETVFDRVKFKSSVVLTRSYAALKNAFIKQIINKIILNTISIHSQLGYFLKIEKFCQFFGNFEEIG